MTKRSYNISSVPLRSPFRYPGGKTWLVPHIRKWIQSIPSKPAEFIEPFSGGGIVSLTVAFEELTNHVTMVELDDQVAAVWKTTLNGGSEWISNRIITFDITKESVDAVLSTSSTTLYDKAFKVLLKNRVSRGGILAAGAGLIKNGESGKGLRSRWYPETLQRRILEIAQIKERITFIEGDGLDVLNENANKADAIFFIDPPYTVSGKKAGSRLYTHSEINHEELFRITRTLIGDFLMTYDYAEEVQALAHEHGFDTEIIAMRNTHHAEMKELLISRNLDWIRQ